MPKYSGFNGSTFKAGRRLNKPQVKQVQRIIEKNKRLKHNYQELSLGLWVNSNPGSTPTRTAFAELTGIPQGQESYQRSESMIQLKSYNIKLGIVGVTDNGTAPLWVEEVRPFRIIIVRSKRGPITDILDVLGASVVDFSQQPDPDNYQVYTDEIHSFACNIGTVSSYATYLLKHYKSFKNKKVPHMLVNYDDPGSVTITNPLYIKLVIDPQTQATSPREGQFQLQGFCHLKFFDKE